MSGRFLRYTAMMFAGFILVPAWAISQSNVPLSARVAAPKLVPVAETKLLMDGLTRANFQGLEKWLAEKPKDPEAWIYARGQALLIAETGNLLMLRPPKNSGQEAWMTHATELRETATKLATEAASRDWNRSRAALVDVANACNRCHQAFRVKEQVIPFREDAK